MTVDIHYDGRTFTEVSATAEEVYAGLQEIVESDARHGIFEIITATGSVGIYVSPHIPVAVETGAPNPSPGTKPIIRRIR
jgi:hypothetical protein